MNEALYENKDKKKKVKEVNDGMKDGLHKKNKNRYQEKDGYNEVKLAGDIIIKVDKDDMKHFEKNTYRWQKRMDVTRGSVVCNYKDSEGKIKVDNLHRKIMGCDKKDISKDILFKNGDERDLRKSNMEVVDAEIRRKKVVIKMVEKRNEEKVEKRKKEIEKLLEEEDFEGTSEEYNKEIEKRLKKKINEVKRKNEEEEDIREQGTKRRKKEEERKKQGTKRRYENKEINK